MLRRSDFIAATYALSFVFANFGIAIAARMPMMTTTIRSSMSVKPLLLRISIRPLYRSVDLSRLDYGAESVNTIGKLYVPGTLLGCVKPAAQTVLKKACAASPFVAAAPDRKTASVEPMPTYEPATAFDQVRSLIGLVPASGPA